MGIHFYFYKLFINILIVLIYVFMELKNKLLKNVIKRKEKYNMKNKIKNYKIKTLKGILHQNRIKIYTHSGVFHADECMSIAIIKMYLERYNPNSKLIIRRNRNIPDNFKGLVLDEQAPENFYGVCIDHHNIDDQIKEDYSYLPLSYTEGNWLGETTLATCGLLWKQLGHKITPYYEKNNIQGFLALINAEDNGEENQNGYRVHSSIASIVKKLNPTWIENNANEQFNKAVELCKQTLEREIANAEAISKANEWLRENMQSINYKRKWIAFIGEFKPTWGYFDMGPDFMIWTNEEGKYMANNKSDTSFPKDWWGKTKIELKKITGVNMNFCHASGFLICCDDYDSIIKAIKITIDHDYI